VPIAGSSGHAHSRYATDCHGRMKIAIALLVARLQVVSGETCGCNCNPPDRSRCRYGQETCVVTDTYGNGVLRECCEKRCKPHMSCWTRCNGGSSASGGGSPSGGSSGSCLPSHHPAYHKDVPRPDPRCKCREGGSYSSCDWCSNWDCSAADREHEERQRRADQRGQEELQRSREAERKRRHEEEKRRREEEERRLAEERRRADEKREQCIATCGDCCHMLDKSGVLVIAVALCWCLHVSILNLEIRQLKTDCISLKAELGAKDAELNAVRRATTSRRANASPARTR